MTPKFFRITMTDGTTFISGPYTRLVRVAAFVRRILSGAEPLVAWVTARTTHPLTGAPCIVRTRTFKRPGDVRAMEHVEWASTQLAPATEVPDAPFWTPALIIGRGTDGTVRVRTDAQAALTGLPVGTVLPLAREDFYGPTETPVAWLNATGERTWRPRAEQVWEHGALVAGAPVMDEDDAAADHDDSDEDESSDSE